jgi:hypothetical protein
MQNHAITAAISARNVEFFAQVLPVFIGKKMGCHCRKRNTESNFNPARGRPGQFKILFGLMATRMMETPHLSGRLLAGRRTFEICQNFAVEYHPEKYSAVSKLLRSRHSQRFRSAELPAINTGLATDYRNNRNS